MIIDADGKKQDEPSGGAPMAEDVALHIKYKDRPWLKEHSKLSQEWNVKLKKLKETGMEPPPPHHPSMRMKVDEVLDYVREAMNTPEIWEIYLDVLKRYETDLDARPTDEQIGFLGMFKSFFLLKRGEIPNRRPLLAADVVLYRLADGSLSKIDSAKSRALLLEDSFKQYLRT